MQQTDHKMPVGMQKVWQQAVRATADFTPDALDTDAVVALRRERTSLVAAPADQTPGSATLGVRTSFGECKGAARKGNGGDVLLDGAREVIYNDHALGTPPPRGQASQLGATVGGVVLSASDGTIIYTFAHSVKLGRFYISLSVRFRTLKQCGRFYSALYLIPAPDHSIWPRSAVF